MDYEIKVWNRFFQKAAMNENGCYEWQGSLDTSGYGLFKFQKKLYKAHRFILSSLLGEIPKGKVVMHTCDNPACINLDHLRLGTSKENAQDRDIKMRANKRTRDNTHGMAKLTTEEIKAGIELFKANNTRAEVAKYWGVCYAHGCKLIKEYMNDGL